MLDKADELRAKRRTAVTALDELAETMFLAHAGQACEACQPISLLDVAFSGSGMFVNGPFGSNLLTSELRPEGVPSYTSETYATANIAESPLLTSVPRKQTNWLFVRLSLVTY